MNPAVTEPTRWKRLDEIVKGWEGHEDVECIPEIRSKNGREWGMLLMACEAEQYAILCHYWDRMADSPEKAAIMLEIVKRGFFPDFLDRDDKYKRRLLSLMGGVFMNGRALGANEAPRNQNRRGR